MASLKIERGEWVVVCDGAKALILQNAGDARFPDLRTRESYEEKHPPAHEQGTDEPGRTQASVGSARSAMEETDWHEQAERSFLAKLASRLDAAVTAGEIDDVAAQREFPKFLQHRLLRSSALDAAWCCARVPFHRLRRRPHKWVSISGTGSLT